MQSGPTCPSCGELFFYHLGLIPTCAELQKFKLINKDVEKILKGLYEMSKDENWDEGRAQTIVIEGGEMYEKYYLTK